MSYGHGLGENAVMYCEFSSEFVHPRTKRLVKNISDTNICPYLAKYDLHAKTSFTNVFLLLMRSYGYVYCRLIQRIHCFKARRWHIMSLTGTSSYMVLAMFFGFHESVIRPSFSAVWNRKIDPSLYLYVTVKATDHAVFKPAGDAAEKHMISLLWWKNAGVR